MTEKDITLCNHGSGYANLKNMYDYLESRYNQFAPNGKRKCVICVRRLKALEDTRRPLFHDAYKLLIGRNRYSQDLRQYVYTRYSDGAYYSDCSSSGCATYKKIGYNVSLLNTAGIYQSSLFETVPVNIKNGHITNPEILKVGDAILFVGSDPSRPLQIGHVSYVYEIPETKWEKQQDGSWKYLKDGKYVKDMWLEINGHWYVFDSTGKMITGWFKSKDDWYYMDLVNGNMLASAWINYKGKDYYLDKTGKMVINSFVKSANKDIWYWLDKNGEWDTSKDVTTKPSSDLIVK